MIFCKYIICDINSQEHERAGGRDCSNLSIGDKKISPVFRLVIQPTLERCSKTDGALLITRSLNRERVRLADWKEAKALDHFRMLEMR